MFLCFGFSNVTAAEAKTTQLNDRYTIKEIQLGKNVTYIEIDDHEMGQKDLITVVTSDHGLKKVYLNENTSYEEKNNLVLSQSDFIFESINDSIIVTKKDGTSEVISESPILELTSLNLPKLSVTYPTPWNCGTWEYGNVHTDFSTVAMIISVLVTLGGGLTSGLLWTAATYILDLALPNTYYRRRSCSRFLTAEEWQRYYTYNFFADNSYTASFDTVVTGIETIYIW